MEKVKSNEQITPMRKDFPHLKDDKTAAEKFADKYKKRKGRMK